MASIQKIEKNGRSGKAGVQFYNKLRRNKIKHNKKNVTVKIIIMLQIKCKSQIDDKKKTDLNAMLPFLKPKNNAFYENLLLFPDLSLTYERSFVVGLE